MKSLAVFACAALMGAGTLASAAEPNQPAEREKAVMLYFSKSFGSDQRHNRSPLAFGLRLQQSSPFDTSHSIAVFDARYSLGGRKTLALAGLNAFESTSDSSQESSGESSVSSDNIWKEHPYLTSTAVVLAVLGLMCATETGLCEKSGYRRTELESPSTPGT
jgi:hypothetical protein